MEDFKTTISDEALKKSRRMIYLMMGFLPIMMLVFCTVFFYGTEFYYFMLPGTGISGLVLVVISLVMTKTMQKRMALNELILTDGELVRQNGGVKESVRYDEIKQVKVLREYNGKVRVITVRSANSNLQLHSFLEMDQALFNILAKVDEGIVKVNDRKIIIDFLNPFIFATYLFILMAVIVVAMRYFNTLYNNLSLLFPIAFGLYFILGRPISNASGKKFRKFELIVGPLLLVSGTFTIVMKFLNF